MLLYGGFAHDGADDGGDERENRRKQPRHQINAKTFYPHKREQTDKH